MAYKVSCAKINHFPASGNETDPYLYLVHYFSNWTKYDTFACNYIKNR
jgi:hypothetical protein